MKKTMLIIVGVFCLLTITLSIAYYLVIIPSMKEVNNQKQINANKAEQEKKDKEKSSTKLLQTNLLNNCLSNEDVNYEIMWLKECDSIGSLSNDCEKFLNYDEWLKENNTNLNTGFFNYYSLYLNQSKDCSCKLPTATAENINTYYKNGKDECFKKYPVSN